MYTNPILDIVGLDQGDPAILRYLGTYYLYHTGSHVVNVYVSEDLVTWTPAGVVLEAAKDKEHWAQIDLWAPEVIYENGRFYMYVTGAELRDGKGDDHKRRIGVAVASDPLGPFVLSDKPLVEGWSIDAHPFKDADGTYYMFYNIRNEFTKGPNGVVGCGNVVDTMVSLEALEGKPSFVCKPEFPWEGSLEEHWYWNEGPFVLRRLGVYYQMYSGGCFYQPTYHLAYATSMVCRGPEGMDDRSWLKWPAGVSEAILKSNDEVWGPGHHVVTKGPNGVHDYVLYHGHADEDPTRTNFIDPLYWHGDCLFIDGPTARARLGPFLPRIFKAKWDVLGLSLLDSRPLSSYLWEFWWPGHTPGKVLLASTPQGELLLKMDGENTMEVSLSLGQDQAAWDLSTTVRKLGVELSATQLFRVQRNCERIEVFLSGVLIWQGQVEQGPSLVGWESTLPITVCGVVFTPFFRDTFTTKNVSHLNSALVTLTVRSDLTSWIINEGNFTVIPHGVQGESNFNSAFKKAEWADFELQVDIFGKGKAGVYPVYVNEQNNIKLELDLDDHSLAIWDQKGKLVAKKPYKHHKHKDWQHVRVQKIGREITVYLGEMAMAEFSMEHPLIALPWCFGMFAGYHGKIDNFSVVELNL